MSEERYALNRQLAQMLKGGVIMDPFVRIMDAPSAILRNASPRSCAVMALEKIPADIRAAGGVARMSDPKMIRGIQEAVSIPVMAKCRIGHLIDPVFIFFIRSDRGPWNCGKTP